MNQTGEMQCRDMLCSDINCFLTIYVWNIFNSQQAPKCINNAWVKMKVRKYEDCNNEIQCNQKHEKKTVKIYNVMALALCPSNVFELFIGHT